MKLEDVCFLELEDVHAAHDAALELAGGAPGVRDLGMILSAIAAPQTGYYSSLAELAAVYVHGLAKNHGYIDGNKRTALLVMLKFLGAHGIEVDLELEWVQILESVANGQMTRTQLEHEIRERLMGGDPITIDE